MKYLNLKTRTTSILAGGALVLAASLPSGADAALLWGTTFGIGDTGFFTGGEIFTVDTADGTTAVKHSYSPAVTGIHGFGDIAVHKGQVYVTYYDGADGFDKLAKVNTTDWSFDWTQDLGGSGDQVNALEFIGGTLYGVTGGGVSANLLRFSLTGSGATVTNLGNIGINSDGDITADPDTGTVYYTAWETGSFGELNTVNLGVPSKTYVADTPAPTGWAGLAFTPDGTMWAGSYFSQNLYTMNTANAAVSVAYNLGTPLGGNITGLSFDVPEPASLALFGLGLVGLGFMRRRRAA